MKHLKNIWEFLKRAFSKEEIVVPPTPDPNPPPDPGVYMTQKEVRAALIDQLSGKFSKSIKIYLPDTKYYCPSLAYTKKVLAESMTDARTYVAETHDCDDFAIMVKSDFVTDAYRNGARRAPHCIGIVWGLLPGSHALNWVLNSDGILRFIEAQTDAIFLPRENDKGIWLMLA